MMEHVEDIRLTLMHPRSFRVTLVSLLRHPEIWEADCCCCCCLADLAVDHTRVAARPEANRAERTSTSWKEAAHLLLAVQGRLLIKEAGVCTLSPSELLSGRCLHVH